MNSEPMQDGPNTHHFRTYRACTYQVVETIDIDGVTHRFHVPLEVVAAITSPFNQRDIDRNKENADLRRRVGELESAAASSVNFIDYTFEFWDWSAFPNLREATVHLRNQLESAIGKEPTNAP